MTRPLNRAGHTLGTRWRLGEQKLQVPRETWPSAVLPAARSGASSAPPAKPAVTETSEPADAGAGPPEGVWVLGPRLRAAGRQWDMAWGWDATPHSGLACPQGWAGEASGRWEVIPQVTRTDLGGPRGRAPGCVVFFLVRQPPLCPHQAPGAWICPPAPPRPPQPRSSALWATPPLRAQRVAFPCWASSRPGHVGTPGLDLCLAGLHGAWRPGAAGLSRPRLLIGRL